MLHKYRPLREWDGEDRGPPRNGRGQGSCGGEDPITGGGVNQGLGLSLSHLPLSTRRQGSGYGRPALAVFITFCSQLGGRGSAHCRGREGRKAEGRKALLLCRANVENGRRQHCRLQGRRLRTDLPRSNLQGWAEEDHQFRRVAQDRLIVVRSGTRLKCSFRLHASPPRVALWWHCLVCLHCCCCFGGLCAVIEAGCAWTSRLRLPRFAMCAPCCRGKIVRGCGLS